MQGEEENRLQIPHNLVLLILFSGAKVPLFSFSEKKIGEGKISKALATPKAPLPMSWYCFNTTVSFSRNKSEGKISRKKKQMERTHALAQMIRVLL